ncbi:type VI secretion system Vgr family protein [Inhella proteolytica]|uniref:Type VI secretion system tip protein VgrG n=1 Tax=Inhella proteolytica TaxID=2795029 RepID=A0A931J2U4_9BURK|nr:type VI secretion system tip protein TssI/VgrG [Inhella proteolytica]MBH9577733.1 type VI secretion system tip protein VgrG [Inhella proteolytica]
MPLPLAIDTTLGPHALLLLELDGTEGLSRLSEFRLRLKSKRPDIAPTDMLGQNATMRLIGKGEQSRYFNGYFTRWTGASEYRDTVDGATSTKSYIYEATLSPWLWFLQRQSNSRIFQNKSALDIIETVFRAHGALCSFRKDCNGSYRQREYCVQYRETDFNFVSRLMEEEGIYYFFEHSNGKHELVLADNPSAHTPATGYEEVHFDSDSRDDKELMLRWEGVHEVQSGRFVVRDYDYIKPRTLVEGQADKALSHPLSSFAMFDDPAGATTATEAKAVAKLRLEALHARYQVFRGFGPVRGFSPGRSFKLAKHPVAAYNDKHLIVATRYLAHSSADSSAGDQGFEFRCELEGIALKTPFRPAQLTPKPLISGPQTATVVGPSGEEIHVDKHGRIKVQFRWDRYGKADQDASCWIRVMQPWAGNGYGAIAIPRLGQEVVVQFLEGDPDRPLVIGSVYNGENVPPYKLPDEKTRWGLKSRSSSGGGASNFNELRFEDKKGSEEIYLRAEKDLNFFTNKKRTEWIGDESHLKVEKDVFEKLVKDVHTDIGGDQITKVAAGVHLKVGTDWQADCGTKMAAKAGTEIHLKAGTTIVLEASAQISLKCGGSFVNVSPAGVHISGPMVFVNSGGSAGSGSGASPDTPKNAEEAKDSKGGTDKPISQSAAALAAARASSTPFCEICNA